MAATATYIHGLGLRAGIYTASSYQTCAGYLGSYQTELIDAMTFASWGYDFLKLDECGTVTPYADDSAYWSGISSALQQQSIYQVFSAALRLTGRSIVYSLGGPVTAWASLGGSAAGGNMWRIASDSASGWAAVDAVFDHTDLSAFAGPTLGWNDPDNIYIQAGITSTEFKAQMSLFALLAAPLILGNDLTTMTSAAVGIAGNTDVIAVDQDALGLQGKRISHTACGGSYCDVFARQLAGTHTCAIAAFNRASTAQDITITFATVAAAITACGSGPYTTTANLWGTTRTTPGAWAASLGTLTTSYTATAVPSHGVVMIKVAP
jgi:alpha-galactosidase